MLVVCAEVFKRYALNAPTAWIYDANNMMYGTLFMMGGAYTLAQDGHVRGDFLYGSMKPRTQAALDLVLYIAVLPARHRRAHLGRLDLLPANRWRCASRPSTPRRCRSIRSSS